MKDKMEFDETFCEEEIELIDGIIEKSLRERKLVSEQELNRNICQSRLEIIWFFPISKTDS